MPNKTAIHTVYKLQDGSRVPSVTTILGILNKPALLNWAWEMGKQGLDYRAVRDEAGDIGSLAHLMIMAHLKGEKLDTSEYSAQAIDKAENAFLKYLDWEKALTVIPILVETPLVSEQYKFGGTIDLFARVNGSPILLDFKTSKAIYSEHFYQVAGYKQLLSENGYKVEKVKILRIGRDETEGFEEHTLEKLEVYREVFLACFRIYTLQKQIRKGEVT